MVGNKPEIVVVQMLKSMSAFTLPVRVNDRHIDAVVDSAADVTIISEELYSSLNRKPKKVKVIHLDTAGKEMSMEGFIAEPISIAIGQSIYKGPIYVAPIEQDMLLGIDLLRKGQAVLDVGMGTLVYGGERITLSVDRNSAHPIVSRVSVAKRCVIPPHSIAKVKCTMDGNLGDYMIEPKEDGKVFGPRVLHSDGDVPVMCVINTTDHHQTLKKGREIGRAYPIGKIMEDEKPMMRQADVGVNQVKKTRRKLPSVPQQRKANVIPAHLKDTIEISQKHLTKTESERLTKLLVSYADVFAKDEFDLGHFNAIEHDIDTGDAKPVKMRMRRTPVGFAEEEEEHLKKMIQAGVIEESNSDWASTPVLIRKRDGTVRWCIDYRGLNKVTIKDVFPLPLVDDCLDTLSGNVWFTKLDANSAYWQVSINPEDRKKTAFHTKYGLYQHVKMGFGLCNAPATFSRVMNLVLRGLTWKTALAFLDDILIMGKSFDDHLFNIGEALSRFQQYGLKLKPKKCIFFQKEVEFLGRQVTANCLSMTKADIEVVAEWPVPESSKDVEKFMGLANYHRNFVKNFSEKAIPLYNVIGKDKFRWEKEQQEAFDILKKSLTEPPVLSLPQSKGEFILDTDASDNAIGAELLQVQDGIERVVAYGSFALTKEQKRYCTTRKELLAVVRFTRQYRYYLLGRPFTVRTDHSSLTWLLNFKEPQGQLARWMEELSQYNMVLKHRAGKSHSNADALSRRPQETCDMPLPSIGSDMLPCGGCKYCKRVELAWGSFFKDVDDAVPLTSKEGKGDRSAPVVSLCEREAFMANACSVSGSVAHEMQSGEGEIGRAVQNGGSHQFLEDSREVYLQIKSSTSGGIDVKICGITLGVDKNDSSWGFPNEKIREEQSKDSDLSLILNWLRTAAVPTESELFLSSQRAKAQWLIKERFVLIDGIIYHQRDEGEEKDLVVPSSMKEEILKSHHDLPSSGHQGVSRTKFRIRERFYWYGMGKDISTYVSTCSVCSKNKKTGKYGKFPMQEYQASAPMERVHLDFLGPLPKTAQGNEYVLVMVDQFTKWVECVPLNTQTAAETAKAAVDHFFSRFGYPFQVFTDQGRNFESKLFAKLCEILEIHKARTTPYRPSANGQVERFNRTIVEAIRCYIDDAQDQWDRHLQQIAGALRSAVNRNTGFTPNKLMLGREVNIPAHLMFPHRSVEPVTTEEYVATLMKNIEAAHNLARQQLQTSSKRMKRDYDVRIMTRNFKEGDMIYLLDTAVVKGSCKKLSPPWKGPAVIAEKLSESLFRVKLRNSLFVVNHDRMKLCSDRNVPAWIQQWRLNPTKAVDKVLDKDLYCICKQPWQGRFMIQCDGCDEWFHGSCVNVTASEAITIDKFWCGYCKH